jgi:hypothetical protein
MISLKAYRGRWYAIGVAGVISIGLTIEAWDLTASGFSVEVSVLLWLIPGLLIALLVASWLTDVVALTLQAEGVVLTTRSGRRLVPWDRISQPVRAPIHLTLNSSRPPIAVRLPFAVGDRWNLIYYPDPGGQAESVSLALSEVQLLENFPYRPAWPSVPEGS